MRYKMLIVEDEFIVANDLRIILTQAGYEVCGVAASAEEADALLLSVRPDLVLLDIRLDGKRSGIDVARKLRAESLAFVYISANSDQETLEEAKRTDPYGFIVKPFRKRDLLVAIDIALYRHKHVVESRLKHWIWRSVMAGTVSPRARSVVPISIAGTCSDRRPADPRRHTRIPDFST